MNYLIANLREQLQRGPSTGETFFRIKVSGNGETPWVNVTPMQLHTIITALDTSKWTITVLDAEGGDLTQRLASHETVDAGRNIGHAIGSLSGLTTDEARVALSQIIDQGREWGPTDEMAEALYKVAERAVTAKFHPFMFATPDGWTVTVTNKEA